ncbi:hypothetical protein SRABI04_01739 [Chryseobacterium sp. Bi04]|nr:hypothetical protein SRABI04_01739 [Chryseobacterium sp. Bi04]
MHIKYAPPLPVQYQKEELENNNFFSSYPLSEDVRLN